MPPDFTPPMDRSPLLPEPIPVTAEELAVLLANHRQWLESKGQNGSRAVLINRDLRGCVLDGAEMARARLELCDLRSVSLDGARITGARFDDSDLGRSRLGGCDGDGASFFRCHAPQASFANARLNRACFMLAHLDGADLSAAELAGADFDGASYRGADFCRANLRGAILSRCTQSQVEDAIGDRATQIGEGVTILDDDRPGQRLTCWGGEMVAESAAADRPSPIRKRGKWTPIRCAYWRALPEAERPAFEQWVRDAADFPALPPG